MTAAEKKRRPVLRRRSGARFPRGDQHPRHDRRAIAVNTNSGTRPRRFSARRRVHTYRAAARLGRHPPCGRSAAFPFQLSAGFSGFSTPFQLPGNSTARSSAGADLPRVIFACATCSRCSDPAHERLDVRSSTPGFQPRRRRVFTPSALLGGPERRPVRPDAGEVVCSSVAQGLG